MYPKPVNAPYWTFKGTVQPDSPISDAAIEEPVANIIEQPAASTTPRVINNSVSRQVLGSLVDDEISSDDSTESDSDSD